MASEDVEREAALIDGLAMATVAERHSGGAAGGGLKLSERENKAAIIYYGLDAVLRETLSRLEAGVAVELCAVQPLTPEETDEFASELFAAVDIFATEGWRTRALKAERALARIRALVAPEVRCPMPGISRDALAAILREAGALAPRACATPLPDQHLEP